MNIEVEVLIDNNIIQNFELFIKYFFIVLQTIILQM